jgi:SNF2 family DNA or RNA helicase
MDQTSVNAYLARIRAAGDADLRPCSLVTDALVPMPAQRVGIAHLFLRPRFLLADPTGSGKTPMSLAAYGYLKEKDPTLKLLVVTTKSAQFQWRDSVHQFLKGMRVAVAGHDARSRQRLSPGLRKEAWQKGYGTYPLGDMVITTYATMALDVEEILTSFDHYITVFDELHWVKSHKQDTLYPAALKVGNKARGVWGLSATPIKNGRLDELFSVMELVRPGTFGDASVDIKQRYSRFRRQYYQMRLVTPRWKAKAGKPAPRPFYEIIGTQNLDHLTMVVDPFYLMRPKHLFRGHKGLPEVLVRREDIELDAKQAKVYREIWAQQWPGKHGQKMLKIAALTKAQQLLTAPELVGQPHVPNAKLKHLLSLLTTELQDEKCIVYTKYAQAVPILSQALTEAGVSCVHITGDTSMPQRDVARSRFQTDPGLRVIVVTDAGGESLDLQAAGVVVCYDLPWSSGQLSQVIGRAHRIGATHASVLSLLLVATHSCDESILLTLTKKQQATEQTLTQATAAYSLTSTLTSPTESDTDTLLATLGET